MGRLNLEEKFTAYCWALAAAAYKGCKINQLSSGQFELSNPPTSSKY
jgi:hypothetical protein